MTDSKNSDKNNNNSSSSSQASRDEKLARQLRDNLAKRKTQSRARNTKPRKFKNRVD